MTRTIAIASTNAADATNASNNNRAAAVTAAVAALLAAGCQIVSDPPRKAPVVQDVEFLRGCWVAKEGPNGPITAFLRLLPDGSEGANYQGYLQSVKGGGTPGAEMTAQMHLSFRRDGSSMTMREPRGGPSMPLDQEGGQSRAYAPLPEAIKAKLPAAEHRASYAIYPGTPTTPFMLAEGSEDRLAIFTIGNAGQPMGDIFRGERDGCD